ncbi:MAG: LytR family transcriptional regulator, partial [Conexibacter sp.]|nr:LytR family transcriptional regulator [Conexibacter sp.]
PAPARTVLADPAAPRPGTFTVAVLNATTAPGLARGVANRLQNAKHKIGNVTNAAAQDLATTQVYYARPSGSPAAAEVAQAIGLPGQLTPRPAPRAVRVIAGDQAAVIVLVGADQNTSPQH